MKAIYLSLLCLCLVPKAYGQSFENGNLEGEIPWGATSVNPPGWESVAFTEIISEATSFAQATSDLTDSIAPSLGWGIIGSPYAGVTFVSGNYAYFEGPDWTMLFHEGIKQNVTEFCPGGIYEISFFQTVVKQGNLQDTSGLWRVYLDNDLLIETEPTISHEAYNSLDLPWERRTVTFTATSTEHYIKFLPGDDDDFLDEGAGLGGGLRMGIDSISLRVFPVDILAYDNLLGNDTTLCEGEVLTLAPDAIGVTYEWQDGSDGETFEVSEDGLYWVEISNPCVGTYRDSIIVLFNPMPELDLGADTTVCSIDLLLDAENIAMNYLWQDGSTDQFLTVTDTGTYSVTVTSDSGCTVFDAIVFEAGELDLWLGNDTLICNGETVLLSVAIETGLLLWSTGETSETLSVNSAGLYWLTIEDGLCLASDSIIIDVQEPIIDFTFWDTIGCVPYATSFHGFEVSETIILWEWDFGDGGSSNLVSEEHFYEETGDYFVQLKGTTILGCVAEESALIQITVYPQPTADFTFMPELPLPGETVFFNNLSTNELEWVWDYGNGNGSSSENPEGNYENPGNYEITLIVTNHICADTIIQIITVKNELVYYVPNAFSPDGDSYNNTFQPVFTSGFDPYDYHLTIFNRWGEVVFESYDASYGWDGTYGGNAVTSGVYIWKIEFGDLYTDRRINEAGHVMILR
ncbi:MAG: gliding motility-associated-like protein [Crocinitomix sp.]|jgi:gliding motility-associated-like protein